MKKFTKLLAFALILVLAFAGCNKSETSSSESSDSNNQNAESETADSEDKSGESNEKDEEGKEDSSSEESNEANSIPENAGFEELCENAKGKTVNFYGWGGDDKRNAWIDNSLAPRMKEKYDVTINRVPMNIDEILNLMMSEKHAGKDGSVDVVWINGENFASAKSNELLFGPFTQNLPNFEKNIDSEAEDIKYDFGTPTEGFEAPYGKAQFVFLYDSDKIENPPKNHRELLEIAKVYPGKITYAALPDFTGSVFVRNIISDISGYQDFMNKELTKENLKEMTKDAMDYLNELKAYLWKEGETYPSDNPSIMNMFADGELYMAMAYNPNLASNMIASGKLRDTVKTCVFDNGNVGNTHFLAIGSASGNKEAAMLMINEVLSVESQCELANPNIVGDMSVLAYDKLSDEDKEKVDSVPLGVATLPLSELTSKRIPEMPAVLVPLIEQIWEEEVLNKD